MSKVWVNDEDNPVEGSFSFEAEYDDTQKPPILSIRGVFRTSDRYYDDIKSLLNSRYRIDGVKVFKEAYGSEEDEVLYYFTGGRYGVAAQQRKE